MIENQVIGTIASAATAAASAHKRTALLKYSRLDLRSRMKLPRASPHS